MITIEVMTVQKSCERACAHCAFARKEHIIEHSGSVNTEVQDTFSLLEDFLSNRNTKYFLGNGTPSLPMLKINHPKLVKGIGFQINDMEIFQGIDLYSNKIKDLLREKSIKPQVLTFPIITKNHLLSDQDAKLAFSLVNELKIWFFASKRKQVTLTFDYDFGVKTDLGAELDEILASDKLYLLETLKSLCPFPRHASEKNFYDTEGIAKTYITAYKSKLKPVRMSHEVYLEHRVISPVLIKEKNSNDALIASVARSVPRSNGDVSLLIAPAGVMLSHSTVTVNNPIFWVSHRDFRESLVAFRQASWVQVFDIIQFLFWQNEMLFKEASSLGIKDNQMKEYFEENRQMIF